MNRSVGGAVGYGLRRFLRAGVWLVGVVGMAAAIELPLAHRGVPLAPVYVGEAVGNLAEPGGAADDAVGAAVGRWGGVSAVACPQGVADGSPPGRIAKATDPEGRVRRASARIGGGRGAD